LEPLIVGLQIYLNESPRAPQEILEVGQDVAQRIRDLEAKVKNRDSNKVATGAKRK
jgi:hypothetical protein